MKWSSSSSSDGIVSVERLIQRRVTLDWQEAVAIVLEVADIMERARKRSAPTYRNIVLTPTGTVEFLRGRTQTGAPVMALGQMLGELLANDYPTQLRLIMSTSGPSSSSYKNVAEFAEALRYFERPGRRTMLSELHARALTAPMTTQATKAEIEELPKKKKKRQGPGPVQRFLAPVAGFALVFLAIGAVAWVAEFRNPGAVSGPAGAIQDQAATAWDVLRESATRDLSTLADRVQQFSVELEAEEEAEPESTVSDTSASARSVTELARAVEPEPVTPKLDTAPEVAVAAAGAAAAVPAAPEPLLPAVIFDPNDVTVMPPVALSREFPQLPPGPHEDWDGKSGVVEVVVSAQGGVEKVKLVYPPNTVHEAMILSAIKTWQFEPATKDGRPVRFRQLVPVTFP